MLTIVLIIFLPTTLLSVFLLVSEKPAIAFKEFRKKHPKFNILNTLFLIIFGILIGLLTDQVDFSNFASGDYDKLVEEKNSLKDDLSTIYNIDNKHIGSVVRRLDNLFSTTLTDNNSRTNIIFPILLSITLMIYLTFTILSNRSEKLIEIEFKENEERHNNEIKIYKDKLKEINIEKDGLENLYDYLSEVMVQLKTYKIAKIDRLEKTSHLENISSDCRKCLSVLDPKLQLKIITKCLLLFFNKTDKTLKDNYLRVGIFLPDSNNKYLEVMSSIDTLFKENVIISPSDKHKERFILNSINPGSLAVESYYSDSPIIVSNCNSDNTFNYFDSDQKKRIKSIVATPLLLDNNIRIGVLMVDCSTPSFFSPKQNYEAIFKMLSQQVSSWIYHEKLLDQFLSKECVNA